MYPDTVNLPFNFSAIRDFFVPCRPGEPEPPGAGLLVPIRGNSLIIRREKERSELPEDGLSGAIPLRDRPLFVGHWKGRVLRCAMVAPHAEIPAPYAAEPFNSLSDVLDDAILTLGGLCNQILQWQEVSRVCSKCGGELGPIPGTWGKKCRSCRHEHYPHIHPCIIVLVKRGDEFLLVRKPEWPEGRYSLIAGFLDFGESLEECVRREVEEEAGIRIGNVRYVGSQNWPFPSQLMAGFTADWECGEPRADGVEIADARWFSRLEMPPSLPGKRSIARWIIDTVIR